MPLTAADFVPDNGQTKPKPATGLTAADFVPDTGAQPGAASRFISGAWESGPVMAAKGTADMAVDAGQHMSGLPLGAVQGMGDEMAQVRQEAQDAWSRGEHGVAIAKALESTIPMFGPWASKQGDKLRGGDIAGALGSATGMATTMLGPKGVEAVKGTEAVTNLRNSVAERIQSGALKPTGRSMAKANAKVRTSLDEKLSVTEGGLERGQDLRQESGAKIGATVRSGAQPEIVTAAPIIQELEDFKSGLLKREQAQVDSAIADLKNEFGGRNLKPAEAHELKVKYQDAVIRAKKSAYAAGADNPISVETDQISGRKLGEQLVAQFPELAKENARYGGLSDVLPDLEAAVTRAKKRNPLGLAAEMATAAGGIATGHSVGAVATVAGMEALRSPALRSKLAIALSKANRGMPLPVAKAKITAYVNSLGATRSDAAPAATLPSAAESDEQNGPPAAQDLTDAAKRKAGFDPNVRLQEYAKP